MANFERDLLQSVHDERTLFLFATRRWGGIGEGLAHLLQQVSNNFPKSYISVFLLGAQRLGCAQ